MVCIGSALFNADHTRLGDELRRTEAAGVEFFHLDVFDGYFVPDQAFPPRTIKALRPLSKLPFEVHLAAHDPLRFLPALADAGADLVFLPAESTALLYETIYAVREKGMKAGLCLALGTPLALLPATLPMIDAVLLLGRVTGEGKRGRDFNRLVVDRVAEVRRMIDAAGVSVDLQAAGGLETDSCVEVCRAGATSLPIGAALYRDADMRAYVAHLRERIRGEARRHGGTEARREQPIAAPQRGARYKVFVASRSFGKNCPDVVAHMRDAGCDFVHSDLERPPTEDEMLARIGDADVLISGTEPVTARVIAAAPKLKVISKHGVGYENIDLAAAAARNIPVTLCGGASTDSVADLAWALLLAVARQVPAADASVKRGEWKRFVGPELRGKTLGVVGLGQIGKAVARRAKGFGMDLVAHDAFEDRAFAASWGVRYLPLDELLAASDFVSLHAPVTDATRKMMNADRLRRMKRTAFLVNAARGELVDEDALYQALKERVIAGAATDVFTREPPGKDHPLLALDNFVATPHTAAQTHEALRRMGEQCAENVLRVLRGEKPLFCVPG